MTAKEMFEELGYIIECKKDYILYDKKYGMNTAVISFSLDNKQYACMIHGVNVYGHTLFIDNKTHKAITQQMKELGWLS